MTPWFPLLILLGSFSKKKNDAIQENISTSYPPEITSRVSLSDNLETLSPLISEDDIHKIVMKSKTTSCGCDPIPTKLVKGF